MTGWVRTAREMLSRTTPNSGLPGRGRRVKVVRTKPSQPTIPDRQPAKAPEREREKVKSPA